MGQAARTRRALITRELSLSRASIHRHSLLRLPLKCCWSAIAQADLSCNCRQPATLFCERSLSVTSEIPGRLDSSSKPLLPLPTANRKRGIQHLSNPWQYSDGACLRDQYASELISGLSE